MEFTVVEDLGMAGACAGGHPANCVEIVKHQFKSWLHVTASPTADQCPVDQIKAAGLAYAHVPVEVGETAAAAAVARQISHHPARPRCTLPSRAARPVARDSGPEP